MTRRVQRAVIAATLAWIVPVAADAGDGLSRLFGRKDADDDPKAEAKAGPISSQMNWWAIPRSARSAAKTLAASRDASVTRCVAINGDDTVSYEIHAAHRTGLFKKDEFVLTSMSEPKSTAEQRRREQTLRYRLTHIGKGRKPLSANPEPSRGEIHFGSK